MAPLAGRPGVLDQTERLGGLPLRFLSDLGDRQMPTAAPNLEPPTRAGAIGNDVPFARVALGRNQRRGADVDSLLAIDFLGSQGHGHVALSLPVPTLCRIYTINGTAS